jgi:hypothetical protein
MDYEGLAKEWKSVSRERKMLEENIKVRQSVFAEELLARENEIHEAMTHVPTFKEKLMHRIKIVFGL